MIKILHIIDALSAAGPTRSLISLAKYAAEQNLPQEHRVIALRSDSYPLSMFQAKREGITVLKNPDDEMIRGEIEQADIVEIHYWNNPVIAEFVRRDLPPMRLLTWFMVFGSHPPQVITSELLDYTDFALATTPLTLELPVFKERSKKWLDEKTDFLYGLSDWSRLENLQPQPHENFNVAYIGTVNFSKMYSRFVPMSAGIEVPNIKFLVCGGGVEKQLKEQAIEIGAEQKFEFRGYVENIKPVLEVLDVFGYPLCEDTYATSEKSIQEAMYAGVPPVVFPHGGCADLVRHEETGLVVNNETEYKQAIEYLYCHPEERRKLGRNAAIHARQAFDSKEAAQKKHAIYQKMTDQPKRPRKWEGIATKEKAASEIFAESLGEPGRAFSVSLSGSDDSELMEAEKLIADSSELLAGGEGGINQFRNHDPDDAHLRLWAGLILQRKGHHEKAVKEFDAVSKLGLHHWRVNWYKAQSAFKMGQIDTARGALTEVSVEAPDFEDAGELLRKLLP